MIAHRRDNWKGMMMTKATTARRFGLRTATALALAAGVLASGGTTHAAERAPLTADQQQAFDIYRDIIAIRTARGQTN